MERAARKPQRVRRIFVVLIVWAAVTCGVPCKTSAQTSAKKPNSQASSRIYQDDEIELRVPQSWTIVSLPPPDARGAHFDWLNGFVGAKRKLLLEKDGYILALAYNTEHASGVEGGRFAEVFNIPWPSQEEVGNCSLHLSSCPLPASRTMLFYNLIVETGLPEVREACGIPKDLGYQSAGGFKGERRWLGGFFTTAGGSWFFPSAGEGCGLKTYALTSPAKTPEQMPDQNDPKLRAVVQQAIDIVNSIHYKRCPPAAGEQ